MSEQPTPARVVDVQRTALQRLTVASPEMVPEEIAVCPECGGRLWWQVTTDDGLRDLDLDCSEEDWEIDPHRGWMSDWEPVLSKVRRWLAGRLQSCDSPPTRSITHR